jgi:lipoic acid synthetase
MDLPQKNTYLRKPPWLKVRPPYGGEARKVRSFLAGLSLHTVCQEAACPNMSECFASGTATFLILGNICTRGCRYCNIRHGVPRDPDEREIENLIAAVQEMNLGYVVITSVTRDDLPDGGAGFFADCIHRLREALPSCKIEVLIPDFQGSDRALAKIIEAAPDVINHNIEVAFPFYSQLRPRGSYRASLRLLTNVARAGLVSKSGFMVGFGEGKDDVINLLRDLAGAACRRVTIGQYQQPTLHHWPVARYYHPDEFAAFRETALTLGFEQVEAGPLVRSSYRAARQIQCAGKNRPAQEPV